MIEGDELGFRAGLIHIRGIAENDRGCDVDGPQSFCGGRSMDIEHNITIRDGLHLITG